MGHYAKVLNGKVQQVIVAEAEFFETFVDSSPGAWIQTSYNTIGGKHTQGGTPLRGNYAGIGYTYDQANDVFYAPQPFASWVLDQSDWTWKAPVSMPVDGKLYEWDENSKSWKDVSASSATPVQNAI
jgi:hypothetical protein